MRIAIIGAGGRLGAALLRAYRNKFDVTGFDRAQLDITNFDEVRAKLGARDFDLLINAAAFTRVDLCETQPEEAFRVNAEAPGVLAEICSKKGARLIHFSTDYVFDGEKRLPYTEEDEARPISVYGVSKLAGERNVLQVDSRYLVVRVSWVFGPDRPSFIDAMIQRARESETVDAVADKFSTPTYTLDIAAMLPRFFAPSPVAGIADPGKNIQAADFAGDTPAAAETGFNDPGYSASDCGGILHFANAGECSWQQYAQWAIDCCRNLGLPMKARTVAPCKLENMSKWIARRPVYSVLATAKYTGLTGAAPRTWRDAVSDYITRFYSTR